MGYKKKISKKEFMTSEAVHHLNEISRIGSSRFAAKKVGEASAYIYSIKTYEGYKKSMTALIDFCIKNHSEVKHVDDCRKYVEEFISWMIDNGYSSYTQKSRLSGFRKYYNDRFENIKTEGRKRSQIRRGRTDTAHARQFSEKAHADLV